VALAHVDALEDELRQARAERDDAAVDAQKAWQRAGDLSIALTRAEAERDCAVKRANEAERERDARRESLAQEIRIGLKQRGKWAPNVASDLITAIFKALDEAEASAAAMREAIVYASMYSHPWRDPDGKMSRALSTDAGRALLDRLRVAEKLNASFAVEQKRIAEVQQAHMAAANERIAELQGEVERLREVPPEAKPRQPPKGVSRNKVERQNAGITCDVKEGPCACGAWHNGGSS
jgi:hypothetical protein